MIPRPLVDVDWSDITHLVQSGREEDDRLEFKGSFKGSDDYTALNDSQRQVCLDAIAREVIAFLNSRGGDIIVGIQESEDKPPAAAAVLPIKNTADAADRVARGLAAIIEPAQTNIGVRAISPPGEPSGVLLIRVEPSVRAPHRSKRTLTCYARRGSESVPMAMDEIQDLTIHRTRLRLEQSEFLDRQFADFLLGRSEHRQLGPELLYIRTVISPILEQSFTIDDALLAALGHNNPLLYNAVGRSQQNDVAFRGLHSRWNPVLRGMKRESFETLGSDSKDFQYARKVVRESGVCIFDFAANSYWDSDRPRVHAEWLVGYFAQVLANVGAVARLRPSTLPCTARVGISSRGPVDLCYGSGMWAEKKPFPEDIFFLPDFVIRDETDLDPAFRQFQIDLYSLVNLTHQDPLSLCPPSGAV